MKDAKKNGARIVILTLVLLFLALYMTQATGYDAYNRARKTALTNQEIASFEQAIKEGKEIDTQSYLQKTEKNYNNKLSQLGLNVSLEIEKAFQKGMNAFFKALEDMAKTN